MTSTKTPSSPLRIAIVGAGLSGIAFASVLKRFGHQCVLFEKAERAGGIWAVAYPGVHLQNSFEQYHLSDYPWPERPHQHPSGQQVRDYCDAASKHFELDIRLRHQVCAMREFDGGWELDIEHDGKSETQRFDYAVLSIGQYTEGKHRPRFPGEELFNGDIITERDVHSHDIFDGKRVAVVGFGKSAVDMAAFAVERAARVDHVFRTPRWLIPFGILGLHYSYPFFARATTAMMPSWVHATSAERVLHQRLPFVVRTFWKAIGQYMRLHINRHARGLDAAAKKRLGRVIPAHSFAADLRSATAMAPRNYFQSVATGKIEPHHAEVSGFTRDRIELKNGEQLEADTVVLACGSASPTFPFLADKYRSMLESGDDGPQLYRHLLHPRIPRLAFAGYNHGFMHIPSAEIGALWLGAYLRGDLELPTTPEQERSMASIQQWKRQHIHHEPSRSCAVSTRFQQYMDAMLLELGLSPYRKMPNPLAEFFMRYGAADYAGVVDEYLTTRPAEPRSVLKLDI